MAHAAFMNGLTDQLIGSIHDQPKNKGNTRKLKERTLRTLKDQSAPRTNPFEIAAKYEGLVEKFEVFNREDLAAALKERLAELPSENKWLPEALALLLHLSDRPVEKTPLEYVEQLKQAQHDDSSLTWRQILEDDPFDDPGIWENVDRGYHSSGDESDGEALDSDLTVSTQATSVFHESPEALARRRLIRPDETGLDAIRQSEHFTASPPSKQPLSELMFIRESLSMLQGLPSHVYTLKDNSNVSINEEVCMSTVSTRVLQGALKTFGNLGSSLSSLRRWIHSAQRIPFIQSVQGAAQQHLAKLALDLAEIECQYCPSNHQRAVVSISDVLLMVESLTRPLSSLSIIVQKTNKESNPFALLDELYAEACMTKVSGNWPAHYVLVDILLAGLKTYLRPAATWVACGELNPEDQTFFVQEDTTHRDRSNLWHLRYTLRTFPNGHLFAPTFMKPFGNRVLALGKSQSFLQSIDSSQKSETSFTAAAMPALENLRAEIYSQSLVPFSQTISIAMDSWLRHGATDGMGALRSAILHDHLLLDTQRALERVFCSSNGAAFQTFATTLFSRMSDGGSRWKDQFLLTELAQSTLGTSTKEDGVFLSVHLRDIPDPKPKQSSTSQIKQLEELTLEYALPWPIQNITQSSTPQTHSQIFTLLLQVYCAREFLQSTALDVRLLDQRPAGLLRSVVAALQLRHNLLWFIDLIQAHIAQTTQILGASVRRDLQNALDIDGMTVAWTTYEKRLKIDILVAQHLSPLKDGVVAILELCEKFAGVWKVVVSPAATSAVKGNSFQRSRGEESSLLSSVERMKGEFDKLLSFTSAGLRSIGRAGGNHALGALAERLDWRTDVR